MNSPEILPLWSDPDLSQYTLTRYLRPNDARPRPAMLVVPGGGYEGVCMLHEGTAIADRFQSLGFQAFILKYRVAPHEYPEPQQDILRAVKLIRAHAADWHVIPDNIAAVGFSAGGHLVASAGIFHDRVSADNGDTADNFSGQPNASVLCYPVISGFTKDGHDGSCRNLLGSRYEAMAEEMSLHLHVTDKTPPAYLWHTFTDQIVPYRHTKLFADALRAHNIPCSEHIFPEGRHGMSLGFDRDELSHWPEDVRRFLAETCHFRFPRRYDDKRTVVLSFDDSNRSHLEVAAPALLKYGFTATFFPTRFNPEWCALHGSTLLTGPELGKLHRWGFEIGNHTWGHPLLSNLDQNGVAEEIEMLNRFLVDNDIPLPITLAYPGGPYPGLEHSYNVRHHGFKFARTTEERIWQPEIDDPLRIPAFSIHGDDPKPFQNIVEMAEPGHPAVILYHGVPETVHMFCNTPEEIFLQNMKYLHDHDFNVVSFRDYCCL